MTAATVHYATLPTALGDLLVTDHGRGLSGLYFPDHRRGRAVGPDWVADPGRFDALAQWLAAYLDTGVHAWDLPLDLRGTELQQTVWQALCAIPTGTTTSYGDLAAQVGRPGAARAIAGAVARNPVSIVVPCHRVVGARGTITGYAGGVARKQRLLTLEGVVLDTLGTDA